MENTWHNLLRQFVHVELPHIHQDLTMKLLHCHFSVLQKKEFEHYTKILSSMANLVKLPSLFLKWSVILLFFLLFNWLAKQHLWNLGTLALSKLPPSSPVIFLKHFLHVIRRTLPPCPLPPTHNLPLQPAPPHKLPLS